VRNEAPTTRTTTTTTRGRGGRRETNKERMRRRCRALQGVVVVKQPWCKPTNFFPFFPPIPPLVSSSPSIASIHRLHPSPPSLSHRHRLPSSASHPHNLVPAALCFIGLPLHAPSHYNGDHSSETSSSRMYVPPSNGLLVVPINQQQPVDVTPSMLFT
jgi:hypothetical protein